jgi:large subunit ribosomal protein L22
MGSRKHLRAEQLKKERKTQFFASLRNCPTSPRKMRLVADIIRGEQVNRAIDILRFSPQDAARRLEKLLLSAISNWQAKNEGIRIEDATLFISELTVDGGRSLKRIRPAPQGRAHRIKKRSNHVTLFIDNLENNKVQIEENE